MGNSEPFQLHKHSPAFYKHALAQNKPFGRILFSESTLLVGAHLGTLSGNALFQADFWEC